MPGKHEKTLRQLNEEAEGYARFCFDPDEQRRWREGVGKPGSTSYAVVVANRFVPLESVPASAAVLRRYGRGTNLATAELQTLRQYLDEIDGSLKRLHSALVAGEAIPVVRATGEALPTWPAVGVAESEDALRSLSLLMLQFERIRRKRISWNRAEGSTYPIATNDGMYFLIDCARYG